MIDATNRNSALASALVEELARCGLRRAVLSPGSRSSPIALAMDRESAIDVSVVLDERAAGFHALGMALASGHPVAVACTSGSAAANLHPAVVEADLAGVPLLMLTSDRPPELRDVGAGQAIDQIKLFGASVRWFCEVGNHEADDAGLLHFRATACRAVGEATATPGPVHLNLPWRDPLGPEPRPADVSAQSSLALEGRAPDRPLTMPVAARTANEALLEAVAEAVAGAERPLLIAGRSPDPASVDPIVALSRRTGAPVLAEPTSQLRFGPHDRSAVVTAYDLILRDPPDGLRPDLVLRFGDMPTSKALRAWLSGPDAPEQLVVASGAGWNEPTRQARALIEADAAAFARELAERLDRPSADTWLQAWQETETAALQAIDEVLEGLDELSEPSIARAVSGILGEGEQLLLASSMPIRDAESFTCGAPQSARLFSNRGANGIDGLLSTASGIRTAGGRRTWALIGDLALAHDIGGLATESTSSEPLVILLIDNGGGRIFEFLPQAEQVDRGRFDRLFITPSALEPQRVADLFGFDYTAPATIDELRQVNPETSTLVHLVVNAEDNVALHRRIAEQVARRIRGG